MTMKLPVRGYIIEAARESRKSRDLKPSKRRLMFLAERITLWGVEGRDNLSGKLLSLLLHTEHLLLYSGRWERRAAGCPSILFRGGQRKKFLFIACMYMPNNHY